MSSDHRPTSMPVGRFVRLTRKELREIVRDRRTIITLVLMPLLVYPLLAMAFRRVVLTMAAERSPSCIVGFEDEETREITRLHLERASAVLGRWRDDGDSARTGSAHSMGASAAGVSPGHDLRAPEILYRIVPDAHSAVVDVEVDLAVRIKKLDEMPPNPPFYGQTHEFEIIYRDGADASVTGLVYIEECLRTLNVDTLRRQLDAVTPLVNRRRQREGRPPFPRLTDVPAPMTRVAIESDSQISFTTLIPLILILMTITGSVYPAIDLTAGERERKTLDTLIAAPIPRFSLLLAKYLAVLCVAIMTASVNLLAMSITVYSLGPQLFGGSQLTFQLVVVVFALMVLFAGFFSAVTLALASVARSFREAQAYIFPLMLMCISPGFLSLMPGLEMNGLLSVTPLINIVLFARDMFAGEAQTMFGVAAVVSTIAYTLAAIGVGARIFGNDALVYDSQRTWSDLFRRPRVPLEVVPLSSAMFCLALLLPLYFVSSDLINGLSQQAIGPRLLAQSMVLAILFGGLPAIFVWFSRVSFSRGLSLAPPRWLAWPAALLIGITAWPIAFSLIQFGSAIGLAPLRPEHAEVVRQLVPKLRSVPLPVVLLSFALAPAIFEELFFRGFLFPAIRRQTNGANAVFFTAILFGLFHVFGTTLTTERLLPATFMGLLLGWIFYRTGSVVPGMLTHAVHNGLMLSVVYYEKELAQAGIGQQEQSHLPAIYLLGSVGGIALGLGLLYLIRPLTRRPVTAGAGAADEQL